MLEARPLDLDAFVERLGHRRLDAGHDLDRCGVAAGGLGGVGARLLEELPRVVEAGAHVTNAARAFALRNKSAGIGERRLEQIPFGDFVDHAKGFALFAGHRVAADDHPECFGHRDEARQALSSARARQYAQLHFGQGELGTRRGDPVMAGECEFESAAHCEPAYGRHDRLCHCVERGDDLVQRGLRLGIRRVEFADVGAAGKRLGRADHDHGLYFLVLRGAGQPGQDALAQRMPQPVDGGVVHRDDGNVAMQGIVGGTHWDS